MDANSIALWSMIAKLITAIITLIGVFVSIWLSIKALREVQRDRRLRQKPFLLFETNALLVAVEFKKAGKSIPGINPSYVSKIFEHLPDDIESVRLKTNEDGSSRFYGKLINYGTGPALNISVSWLPKTIWIGTEKFELDDKKLKEPIYDINLNTLPIIPKHLTDNSFGELSRLPTFIEKDFEKKISQIEGEIVISCDDVFEEKHEFKQLFRIFPKYEGDEKYVHILFHE